MISGTIGNRRTANYVTILGIGFCCLIPFFLNSLILSLVLTFLGCGLVFFMYTLALSMLSQRFKGNQLISANASFIILFEISSLLGPIIAGIMLDRSLNYGLSTFLIIVGAMYLLVAKFVTSKETKISLKSN